MPRMTREARARKEREEREQKEELVLRNWVQDWESVDRRQSETQHIRFQTYLQYEDKLKMDIAELTDKELDREIERIRNPKWSPWISPTKPKGVKLI